MTRMVELSEAISRVSTEVSLQALSTSDQRKVIQASIAPVHRHSRAVDADSAESSVDASCPASHAVVTYHDAQQSPSGLPSSQVADPHANLYASLSPAAS